MTDKSRLLRRKLYIQVFLVTCRCHGDLDLACTILNLRDPGSTVQVALIAVRDAIAAAHRKINERTNTRDLSLLNGTARDSRARSVLEEGHSCAVHQTLIVVRLSVLSAHGHVDLGAPA